MEVPEDFIGLAAFLWPGVVMGLTLALALLFRREGNRLVNRLMALFLFGMAERVAVFVWARSGADMWPLLPEVSGALSWGYGPLFYFFVRAYIERNFVFSRRHVWHLGPIPLALGARLIFWMKGERVRVIEILEQQRLPPVEFRIIGGLMLLAFAAYLFLGIRRIVLYNRHIRDTASFTDALHLRWLIFLAGVMLLPVASVVASLLLVGSPRVAPYVAGAISAMMFIIGFAAWSTPALLNGMLPQLMLEQEEDLEPPRYSSSPLSAAQKERYLAQITAHMEQQRPWLSQEFTLSDLSEQLNVNAKYLSQVINECLGQNFMEFVNGYRVRRAQELLHSPAFQHFTVQAIGQEVGFKSRSAFYNAFREATGQTPAAWRGQLREERLS